MAVIVKSMASFKKSRRSEKDYFEWRKNRARPAVEKVDRLIGLKNKKVLDIGCGTGSLTALLAEKGARVTAVETDGKKLATAKKILSNKKNIILKKVNDEILPFPDHSFDAIFLFDVIEHVGRPEITIKECERLLKKGGLLYVEFTPYYSITGHHLYDYSKLPIHILPESKIKKIIYSKKPKSFMKRDDYWALFKSLNKMRISQFQTMTKNFTKLNEKFIIKYPEVFEINLPFLNHLGPLKDYFTLSFEGIYKKK